MQVTIDSKRITYVDGKPFFLIGARHMPEGCTPEMLRDVGFNGFRILAFGNEGGEEESIPGRLEGIYFWLYLYNRANIDEFPEYENQLRSKIKEVRSHANLLCYENYNEPTLLYKKSAFKIQPEILARGTTIIRKLDSSHPICLFHTCGNTIETFRRFNKCLDIVGCNPYPVYVPGMRQHIGMRPDGRILDCIDQSIHAVGKYTDKMMTLANGKPVWMLIQAMANENWFNPIHTPNLQDQKIDESKILYPTFEQMRFMAFDAIVSGATGLALSMCKTPTQGAIWTDIKRLVGELCSLHDALCSPPLEGAIKVSYKDIGFSIWDGVRSLARRKGNEIYLFAVNTAFDPAEVDIHLPIEIGKVVLVEGEYREVAVENSIIHDYFEPYGVHVYRVQTK